MPANDLLVRIEQIGHTVAPPFLIARILFIARLAGGKHAADKPDRRSSRLQMFALRFDRTQQILPRFIE